MALQGILIWKTGLTSLGHQILDLTASSSRLRWPTLAFGLRLSSRASLMMLLAKSRGLETFAFNHNWRCIAPLWLAWRPNIGEHGCRRECWICPRTEAFEAPEALAVHLRVHYTHCGLLAIVKNIYLDTPQRASLGWSKDQAVWPHTTG
jgi:hypothetical protein